VCMCVCVCVVCVLCVCVLSANILLFVCLFYQFCLIFFSRDAIWPSGCVSPIFMHRFIKQFRPSGTCSCQSSSPFACGMADFIFLKRVFVFFMMFDSFMNTIPRHNATQWLRRPRMSCLAIHWQCFRYCGRIIYQFFTYVFLLLFCNELKYVSLRSWRLYFGDCMQIELGDIFESVVLDYLMKSFTPLSRRVLIIQVRLILYFCIFSIVCRDYDTLV
jgi:hypothetical protein